MLMMVMTAYELNNQHEHGVGSGGEIGSAQDTLNVNGANGANSACNKRCEMVYEMNTAMAEMVKLVTDS